MEKPGGSLSGSVVWCGGGELEAVKATQCQLYKSRAW